MQQAVAIRSIELLFCVGVSCLSGMEDERLECADICFFLSVGKD